MFSDDSAESRAEELWKSHVPADLSVAALRPDLARRNPVYQSWFYPFLGFRRLVTDMEIAKPIVRSTAWALIQSGIITSGYVYLSFKYVHWFVTKHLLNFSYFNLRPMFRLLQYLTGRHLTTEQMEWATAALLTLFQAAILSNSLIGYKIRVQGKRAGLAVLSSRPRRVLKATVDKEQVQERRASGNFLWRLVKNTLWNTMVIPIYTIPIVGQFLFAFLRAPNITSNYLYAFQADKLAAEHRYSAIGFGLVAGFLSAVPLIGHMFSITNHVGAALWIQDMENLGLEDASVDSPPVQEQ